MTSLPLRDHRHLQAPSEGLRRVDLWGPAARWRAALIPSCAPGCQPAVRVGAGSTQLSLLLGIPSEPAPASRVPTGTRRCHLTPVTPPLLSSWWGTSCSRVGGQGGYTPPRRKMDSSRDTGPGLSSGQKGASSLPDGGRSVTDSDSPVSPSPPSRPRPRQLRPPHTSRKNPR